MIFNDIKRNWNKVLVKYIHSTLLITSPARLSKTYTHTINPKHINTNEIGKIFQKLFVKWLCNTGGGVSFSNWYRIRKILKFIPIVKDPLISPQRKASDGHVNIPCTVSKKRMLSSRTPGGWLKLDLWSAHNFVTQGSNETPVQSHKSSANQKTAYASAEHFYHAW